jgi:hypothetical protein
MLIYIGLVFGETAVTSAHRHLINIDCLMVRTAHLVCFISTVNGHNKKMKMPWKMWR